MVKYIEIDRAIETALLLLEEGEDEQTLAYNAALVTFVKNMENQPAADVEEVVRCRDCRWGRKVCGNIECSSDLNVPTEYHGYDWFCPNGERMDEVEE